MTKISNIPWKKIYPVIYCLFILFPVFSQGSLMLKESGTYIYPINTPEYALDEFTLECRFKRTGPGDPVQTGANGVFAIPLISRGIEEGIAGEGLNYFLGIRTSDSVLVGDLEEADTGVLPGFNHPIIGHTPIQPGIWYHAALTYNGVHLVLYLNGKTEAFLEIAQPPGNGTQSKLAIGTTLNSMNEPHGYFKGIVDEIRIWNYARELWMLRNSIDKKISQPETGLLVSLNCNETEGNTLHNAASGNNFIISSTPYEWFNEESPAFLLPPDCQDTPVLKVGLIADPQYCDCDPGPTRNYRGSLQKLEAAVDTFNRHANDYVMILGDMTDRDFESVDSVLPIFQQLNMPVYYVFGNHDFRDNDSVDRYKVLETYGLSDYYYSFSFENWKFIALDGTELGEYTLGLHPELEEEGDSLRNRIQGMIHDHEWNGGLSRKQLNWLENEITESFNINQQVILYCHWPVFPYYNRKNLWNDTAVVELIEQYPNVAAYINGHNHEGNYGFRNGIHYLNLVGMVETEEYNSFFQMNIFKDRLELDGFGLNQDRILYFNEFPEPNISVQLSNNYFNTKYRENDLIGVLSLSDNESTPANYVINSSIDDTMNLYNFFKISNDSLFLNSDSDLSGKEIYKIAIAAMDCRGNKTLDTLKLHFGQDMVTLARPLADTIIDINDTCIIDLSIHFNDQSRFGVQYQFKCTSENLPECSIQNNYIQIIPQDTGVYNLTIAAMDDFTETVVSDEFIITVEDIYNIAPVTLNERDSFIIQINDTLELSLQDIFYDENLDSLVYNLNNTDTSLVNVWIEDGKIKCRGKSSGSSAVLLGADDQRGGKAQFELHILLNTPPELRSEIPQMIIELKDTSVIIDLKNYFTDPDDDELSFKVGHSNAAICDFILSESLLEIFPLTLGESIFTITAYDNKEGEIISGFRVFVDEQTNITRKEPVSRDYSVQFLHHGNELFIQYDIQNKSNLRISIFDLTGRKVFALAETKNRGTYTESIPVSSFKPGLYIIVFKNENCVLRKCIQF